tara:strand:+ start:2427 stop:2723 length:297 start_codon:yes stop_codon:yes gene_type:complete
LLPQNVSQHQHDGFGILWQRKDPKDKTGRRTKYKKTLPAKICRRPSFGFRVPICAFFKQSYAAAHIYPSSNFTPRKNDLMMISQNIYSLAKGTLTKLI